VVLFSGGAGLLLLTQPASIEPRINKLDKYFIVAPSYRHLLRGVIVEPMPSGPTAA